MIARGRARARAAAAVLGAAVGASMWLSAGVLALVEPTRLTRVAAVPGWEWLAGLALGGAAIGACVPAIRAAWPPAALLALLWLPWLPIRVPGAFLLWEGPLERAVWVATITGAAWMLRPRTPPAWARPWFLGPRAPWVAALLSAALFSLAWASVRPRVPVGDEPHYLVITQSLLRDGDLRIENNHQADQYQEYHEGVLKPDFRRRGTDGQIYSIHAPGVSALVAPAFAAFGYPGAVGVVIAVVSLGLAAAWQAAFLLTGSATAAWIGWASVTSSAPLLLHGFTIYPDGPGAAATMLGVLALVWLTVARPPRLAVWTAVGAALATLPWMHTRFAIVAVVLGLALCLRLVQQPWAGGALARLLAVPAVAAAGWFLYFWTIYGTPNPTAPYGGTEGGSSFVPVGLAGLLADQQFGLVANAPVLGAGLVGLAALARRRPRLSIELAAILAAYLAVVATYPMWWGGTSAPGRFAVIVLPLLAVPIADWWAAAPSARPAIVALLVVSAGISLALAGIDRGAFVFNGRDGYDLLLDWLSPTVDLTLAAPSVHRDGAAVALMDAAVWLAATVVVASAVAWLALVRPNGVLTRVASVGAVPLVIMFATTVVWAGVQRPVLTPPTSQMAFLDRWSPARLRVALQIVPSRWLSAADVPRRLTLGTTTRGPLPAGEAALLVLPRVAAGEYDVFVEGRAPLEGTLAVRLGRQSTPMDEWSLVGRHVGFTGLTLSLPATLHSIAITGDDAARQSVEALTLKPRVVAPPERSRSSLRAARFGRVVVFALDDNADLEPSAMWIRGEQDARFVVRADPATSPVLRLDGGPVPNVVTVSSGAWRAQVTLAPGGTADVRVPQGALAPSELTVRSATGFRPLDHAADSHDGRFLGVYVTWPDAPR